MFHFKPIILIQKHVRRYLSSLRYSRLGKTQLTDYQNENSIVKSKSQSIQKGGIVFNSLCKNTALYTGNIINGMNQGYGYSKWKDGTNFQGEWVRDHPDGFGIMEYSDGDRYTGEWLNGKSNGIGIYEWKDGRYEGEWEKNEQSGIGKEIWKDGSVFGGEFLNGKKHGCGIYLWSDKSRYEGMFKEGKQNGYVCMLLYHCIGSILFKRWANV